MNIAPAGSVGGGFTFLKVEKSKTRAKAFPNGGCLALHNSTLYDLKLRPGEVELEISGADFTALSLRKIVFLPVGKENTLHLRRPLTEYEYTLTVKGLLEVRSIESHSNAIST